MSRMNIENGKTAWVKKVFPSKIESWLSSKNRSYYDFETLIERCEQEKDEIVERYDRQD